MRGFLKIVFATFIALVLFTVIGIFILIGIATSAASSDKPIIGSKAVLVLDLAVAFKEQYQEDPFATLLNDGEETAPSLFQVTQLLKHAKQDSSVKGLYILCADNANGFAASEEIRKAVVDFKNSGKFVIAHGEVISQKGYYIGSAADELYCNPQGGVDWSGFSTNLFFLKGMLDKLEIQPQIFYAGKFKSATEPLRETKMTDANKLQTGVWLGELYTHFLHAAAMSRNKDTATLRSLAVKGLIQTAYDAKQYGLVDDLKYDDQIKANISKKLRQEIKTRINFVTLSDYAQAANFEPNGSEKIALVFANANTITGSIGVFSVVPNMQSFFKNKIGVTFDGVKTAPYADMGDISKPLNDNEKRYFQSAVDSIYATFLSRVSDGRKLGIANVDSIAQGRVWTGTSAKKIGLTDRVGGLQDAIDCAARMADIKKSEVKLKEYPEKKNLIEQIMSGYKKSISTQLMKEEFDPSAVQVLRELKQVKNWVGVPQARIPFLVNIQ